MANALRPNRSALDSGTTHYLGLAAMLSDPAWRLTAATGRPTSQTSMPATTAAVRQPWASMIQATRGTRTPPPKATPDHSSPKAQPGNVALARARPRVLRMLLLHGCTRRECAWFDYSGHVSRTHAVA